MESAPAAFQNCLGLAIFSLPFSPCLEPESLHLLSFPGPAIIWKQITHSLVSLSARREELGPKDGSYPVSLLPDLNDLDGEMWDFRVDEI